MWHDGGRAGAGGFFVDGATLDGARLLGRFVDGGGTDERGRVLLGGHVDLGGLLYDDVGTVLGGGGIGGHSGGGLGVGPIG